MKKVCTQDMAFVPKSGPQGCDYIQWPQMQLTRTNAQSAHHIANQGKQLLIFNSLTLITHFCIVDCEAALPEPRYCAEGRTLQCAWFCFPDIVIGPVSTKQTIERCRKYATGLPSASYQSREKLYARVHVYSYRFILSYYSP